MVITYYYIIHLHIIVIFIITHYYIIIIYYNIDSIAYFLNLYYNTLLHHC